MTVCAHYLFYAHSAQKFYYVQIMLVYSMSDSHSVKARKHHGSASLDITIPAKIKREYKISSGDVFIVDVVEEGEELSLNYKRVYSTSDE